MQTSIREPQMDADPLEELPIDEELWPTISIRICELANSMNALNHWLLALEKQLKPILRGGTIGDVPPWSSPADKFDSLMQCELIAMRDKVSDMIRRVHMIRESIDL